MLKEVIYVRGLRIRNVNWTSSLPISGPQPTLDPFEMLVKYLFDNNQCWKTLLYILFYYCVENSCSRTVSSERRVHSGLSSLERNPHQLDTFTSYVRGKQVIQMRAQAGDSPGVLKRNKEVVTQISPL